MTAQMSNEKTAVAPKRHRGRLRVEAILDAGAAIFAQKGFDAATMTEIAARADTAIGSLYRFFPTKDVLSEALLARYWEKLGQALDGIFERATDLPPLGLADALFDMMMSLRADRATAMALLDTRTDYSGKRAEFRDSMRKRLSMILAAAKPDLPQPRADAMAVVLLHALKGVPLLAEEDADPAAPLLTETQKLIRSYVENALKA